MTTEPENEASNTDAYTHDIHAMFGHSGEWDDKEVWSKLFDVLCPYCGHNYVHIKSVNLLDGQDAYTHSHMIAGVRGNVLKIDFWCEQGHRWGLVLGEHKGWMVGKLTKYGDAE
jgi:hypothetical protein